MPVNTNNNDIDNGRRRKNLTHTFPRLFRLSVGVILLISLIDMTGWITGISLIQPFSPYWVTMKPVVTVCFLIISLALVIIGNKHPGPINKTIPVLSGILLTLTGIMTITSWLFLEIQSSEPSFSLLPVFSLFLTAETRMSPLAASIFVFAGIIVILLTSGNPLASDIAHFLCIPLSVAGYLIPSGYILNVYSILQFPDSPVPLNAGIAFFAVCMAFFVLRTDTFLMRVFTGYSPGSIMARRLLPWLILLPVVIGWIRVHGEQTGLFGSNAGMLVVECAYTFCFLLLVWFTARSLNMIDTKRSVADKALKNAYAEMEDKVRERTSELLELNRVLDTEIKERIRAEEMVESERQRINSLLELLPAYLILLTPDYNVAYSNRYFRERFGESPGKRCFEFLFKRHEPCDNCETFKVMKDNMPHTWEWTGPDGRIYSIYDFPYTGSDGSPLIMEMGIDITSLKNAEANLVKLNTLLEERVEERTNELLLANERLDILSRTSGLLLESENPQEVINILCTRVMKFLDCQVFFNYLVDDTEEKLHLNAYAGIPGKTAGKIEWLEFGASVCGRVARNGTRIIAENILESSDPGTELVKSFGIKAYACHPLLSKDKVTGTLSFGTSSRTRFNDDDLSLMKTVADQVAVALARVRNEEFLRRSEERYRSLMELSPSACFVNRNNRVVLLNSAAEKLLGVRDPSEILGKSPFDLFHSDFHDQIAVRIDAILKGGTVPMEVEQIIRADGTVRDVEVVAAMITDSEGPAIQVIMNDITGRKLAEKELFNAKNYLQNLIDFANAPIIVWDQENKIRLFNHAFEHLTGYTSSEVEDRKLDLLFPEETLNESMTKIKRALTENWETIEIPILTKKGDIRTVLWNSAKVYDKGSKTFSTIAQGNDITERIKAERAFKESKEKLDIALENGKIGTWEWETGTDIFRWDERMEKMFGRKPGTFENTFDDFEKNIHEEDLPHVRNAFRQALEKDVPLDTIFRIRFGNDGVNYISTKALVEKDIKGNSVKMSGVCFDITEMKKGAEKALFTLTEDLLRSNKELEQFAYVASHDLQEPLRMVSSFTQLLAQRYKDKLDQDAHDFIRYAVEGASRMQVLINDLLDYSRIETKGRKFTNVDMQEILDQVLTNLNFNIREKNAVVTYDKLPVIFADYSQMVQLFQNLIGNSLKFCKTSPKIHISAREEADNFVFSVKDNGIGIESQYFNKIFQIFQRLHARDEYGGTGIGLAICKRIIDRHGGKIWIESEPGKGSVFYFEVLKR